MRSAERRSTIASPTGSRKHLDQAPSGRRATDEARGPRRATTIRRSREVAADFGHPGRVHDLQIILAMHLWVPLYEGMRRLPGFTDLVADLGFVDYWRSSEQWSDFCRPVGDGQIACE